jgi:hypothetical protein
VSNVIYLRKGAVYFYVGFMDENLTIPIIQTWVYLRQDPDNGFTFESVYGEKEQYCFPSGISSNVLDHRSLCEWLLQEHSPNMVANEYEYKAI